MGEGDTFDFPSTDTFPLNASTELYFENETTGFASRVWPGRYLCASLRRRRHDND